MADLASDSPYASVRTAAGEALNGTDSEIRDFYETGQYSAGLADYRVKVSQIDNTGGPGVKEAAEKALNDGSAQALLSFINSGQYTALNNDERVEASKLVNSGGPEVQAAAKIALSGPADQLHDFIDVGQYMADRKDQLADTHIAQVQRLIAEGGIIAATAQQNRWLAAKAAAEAKQASAEADAAAVEARHSEEAAAGYAQDANTAANSAEASATKAATSATTARQASDRAANDAVAAQESADQAEFSADWARESAHSASEAATQAEQDALAAGKSASEAKAAAKDAWSRVVTLRTAEEAEADRQAKEARKKAREAKPAPRRCIPSLNHDQVGALINCLYGPGDAVLTSPEIDPTLKNIAWEILGLNDAKACAKDPSLGACTMAALAILPVGKVRLLKDGVELIADGTRFARRCFSDLRT